MPLERAARSPAGDRRKQLQRVTGLEGDIALDLLGRRWALRILWELRDGPVGARDLLARCAGLSSSVLYDRLRELAAASVIARTDDGAYDSDWGLVEFRQGRVTEVKFLPD